MTKGIYLIDSTATKVIDGQEFHLVSGYPEKDGSGEYSAEDYAQANANGLILADEITKAYNEGYSRVLVAGGDYFVCAKWSNYHYYEGCVALKGIHNLSIDFNGANIKLIYDSNNYNQFCTLRQYPAWRQSAWVITLQFCTGIKIENLNLIGDAIDRSWTDPDEKTMESTCGVVVGQLCQNISFANVSGRYFMGDVFFGSMGKAPYTYITFTNWNVDKTIDEETGELVSSAPVGDSHSLVSDYLDLDATFTSSYAPYPWSGSLREYVREYSILGEENNMQILPNLGLTSTYQADGYGIRCALYKMVDGVLTLSEIRSVDIFTIIPIQEYAGLRFIICNEVAEDEVVDSVWEHDFMFTLSQVFTNSVVYDGCTIADCHRGGLGAPLNATIKHCHFLNCGMDCGIGAPLFPDTTRYCINQETIHNSSVNIENCSFDKGYLACLINSEKLRISNCSFSDTGDVVVYAIREAVIENCSFLNGCVTSVQNQIGWRGGKNMKSVLLSKNNVFVCDNFSILSVERRTILYEGCLIYVKKIDVRKNKDISFIKCRISFVGDYQGSGIATDNIIEGVYFDGTTLTALDTLRGVRCNNCHGKWTTDNIQLNFHQFEQGERISIQGLKMLSGTTWMNAASGLSGANYSEFRDCDFGEVQLLAFPDVADSVITAKMFSCVFGKVTKPIMVYTFTDVQSKTLKADIINCQFSCNESDVFDKYVGQSTPVTIDAKFGNCYFE